MRITTWNVNSIKAHFEQVTSWVQANKPDVLCLQELKCEDQNFPSTAFDELGYQAALHGQKTYNGVAILSRLPFEHVRRGLPGDSSDDQARYVTADVFEGKRMVKVCCLYLPNGNPAPGAKFDYKLGWMKRLESEAKRLLKLEEAFVLAGDFNVIPAAVDAKNPQNWVEDALFLPQSRAAFQELLALGLTESFRALHPAAKHAFSYWDYQGGAWAKNNGIRIDHLLLSPQAADRLVSAEIDRDARGHDKPSDHVPVTIELK
jgi:exodeoxyribonuclease III